MTWSKYRWRQRAGREKTEKKSIWRQGRRLVLPPEELILTWWVQLLLNGIRSGVPIAVHWACSEESVWLYGVSPVISKLGLHTHLIHLFISATVLLPTQTFIYKDIAEPCVWVQRFLKNILDKVQVPALSGGIETRGEYSRAVVNCKYVCTIFIYYVYILYINTCTQKKKKEKSYTWDGTRERGKNNKYYKLQTWLGFIKQFVFLVAVGGQKSLPRANK